MDVKKDFTKKDADNFRLNHYERYSNMVQFIGELHLKYDSVKYERLYLGIDIPNKDSTDKACVVLIKKLDVGKFGGFTRKLLETKCF